MTAAYHMMGKNGAKEEKVLTIDFFYRGREVSVQRSRASATTRWRQTGLAGTWHGEAVPYLSRLCALRCRFKPTRATIQLGRAQSFTQKLFHLFELALTCKLRNQTLLSSKIYPTLQECILNCNEQLSFANKFKFSTEFELKF
jgi:hypothetical protein